MRSMAERRRRGASRSSTCFQTSSAFGFLLFMVDLERKVDTPESRSFGDHREKSRLTVHAEKGQRLNRSRARRKCSAKRKRAKPRSARRFTRELLYLDIC